MSHDDDPIRDTEGSDQPAPPELPPAPDHQPLAAPPSVRAAPAIEEKNPALAGILSFLVPGLGQIYVGLTWRGTAFFLIAVAIFALSVGNERDLPILLPSLFFVWLFGIFDAHRQATLVNYGYGSAETAPAPGPVSALLPGILLIVLGLYGALRKYLDIDLSWILEHWPIFLMAFGGWLIYKTIRQRNESAEV